MDFFYSIVAFFVTGGVFMYPILLVFAVGVAIAVERYVTLTLVTNKNQVVWADVPRDQLRLAGKNWKPTAREKREQAEASHN